MFSFTLPKPPTTSKDDDLAVLRLIRSRRVGPTTFHRLIKEYGSADAALEALPEVARAAGVRGYQPCPEGVALAELRAGGKAGARLICYDNPEYPALLRQIEDAPPAIWIRGSSAALACGKVAVIGSRNASSLGLRMARAMAAGLGEAGYVTVSGLARGVDTEAHRVSLQSGTIAVMAGGIDVIYPPENEALAAAICENGVLMTEQPPGTAPQARHFPMRNRIISGLSLGTVVVEAAQKSGSLITARMAADHGREVMAVPGHPLDARASGCNGLIRDGAVLVRNAADAVQALKQGGTRVLTPEAPPASIIHKSPPPDAPARSLNPASLTARIISLLGPSPTLEDDLIRDLGLPAATLAPALLELELEGKVTRMAGGKLALVV